MRLVTYGAACSLDGFIAGQHGEIDWLHMSRDVQQVMAEYWATIDTVIMGRKTWEFAVAHGGGGPAAGKTYVFSRTLTGVDFVTSDLSAFVYDLKHRPGKGICMMGGGELAQTLLAAGVIDKVRLNIHPVLLGTGIPLVRDPARRIAMELTDSRVMDGGCVLASYRVTAPRSDTNSPATSGRDRPRARRRGE